MRCVYVMVFQLVLTFFTARCYSGATTLSMTTLSIMTCSSIKGLLVTISINDIQHKTLWTECHFVECHNFFVVMLNVVMLSVVMLKVVAPGLQVSLEK
jgi:hypothetical protein